MASRKRKRRSCGFQFSKLSKIGVLREVNFKKIEVKFWTRTSNADSSLNSWALTIARTTQVTRLDSDAAPLIFRAALDVAIFHFVKRTNTNSFEVLEVTNYFDSWKLSPFWKLFRLDRLVQYQTTPKLTTATLCQL